HEKRNGKRIPVISHVGERHQRWRTLENKGKRRKPADEEDLSRDGETIEEFIERFKIKIERMKGATECMRISIFMH
nr:hypothetical protein [Tanacetum cinerariifolium]